MQCLKPLFLHFVSAFSSKHNTMSLSVKHDFDITCCKPKISMSKSCSFVNVKNTCLSGTQSDGIADVSRPTFFTLLYHSHSALDMSAPLPSFPSSTTSSWNSPSSIKGKHTCSPFSSVLKTMVPSVDANAVWLSLTPSAPPLSELEFDSDFIFASSSAEVGVKLSPES